MVRLRLLCKMKSNLYYAESLVTQDKEEDCKYNKNKNTTKQIGADLIRLEGSYIEKTRTPEESLSQISKLAGDILFCYEEESLTGTKIEKRVFSTIRGETHNQQ